jgi:hypothetical protein
MVRAASHRLSAREKDERKASEEALRKTREEIFKLHHGKKASEHVEELGKVRSTLLEMARKRSCTLKPGETKFLQFWDAVTFIALTYTALLTPFEAAFLPNVVGLQAWKDPWFQINRVLDVVFSVDVILQFFIAYQVRALAARTHRRTGHAAPHARAAATPPLSHLSPGYPRLRPERAPLGPHVTRSV